MRIVNGRDIIVQPASRERPAAAPTPGRDVIVVSRAPRPMPRALPRDPKGLRGQLVDLLV